MRSRGLPPHLAFPNFFKICFGRKDKRQEKGNVLDFASGSLAMLESNIRENKRLAWALGKREEGTKQRERERKKRDL